MIELLLLASASLISFPVVVPVGVVAQSSSPTPAGQEIHLARDPSVSPDGSQLAFAWQRDIWLAPIAGGEALRLSVHPAEERDPVFSPDGSTLAFSSDRTGSFQVYTMPVAGGVPTQVTQGSIRNTLLGFTPDAKGLLVLRTTDRNFHWSESKRVFVLDLVGTAPPRMLFDAGVGTAALSADGTRVLFTRGRAAWNRKGYSGAAALQLWLADLTQSPPTLSRLDEDREDFQNISRMDPMWAPDGESFYFVSDPDGTFDVYRRNFDGTLHERITRVSAADGDDDGVVFPALSRDGKTMVFRRRFDLMSLDIPSGSVKRIPLFAAGDLTSSAMERRVEERATEIVYTSDGKQMAFVSGEDVYVMDRILKEPVRVTDTAQRESGLAFSADDSRLFFVTDAGGEADIWEASHGREDGIWWLAKEFNLKQISDDTAVEKDLLLSPAGGKVAYIRGTELFVMDDDGLNQRRLVSTWSSPSFDWSPDGKWLVYSTEDDDYNSEIMVVPIDGHLGETNLSRHPDNDSDPVWSTDGKRIAFIGQRDGDESDIYVINLTKKEEEQTERDKRLEEALEAMKTADEKKAEEDPSKGAGGDGKQSSGVNFDEPVPQAQGAQETEENKTDQAEEESEQASEVPLVEIDFEGLHDRIHRLSIPDSTESNLIWAPEGARLAFMATVEGKRAFYSVEFPDPEEPEQLAPEALGQARWLSDPEEIVGLDSKSGTPAAMDKQGKVEKFSFEVRRVRDWGALRQISFDQAWRAMRDRFYDERMNNRDWNGIRDKYRPMAAEAIGAKEFNDLMNMMLGELNASHMGHFGGSDPLPRPETDQHWTPTTFQLGLRFKLDDDGPGLLVDSVIPESPCDEQRARVEPGERLLAIDSVSVDPSVDVERLLTFPSVRDVALLVADKDGNERTLVVRPVASVSGLLYDEFVERNRALVEDLSGGTLGYLHIRGMNMSSFRQMEEDLYHAAHGKEGLVLDVRFNGGGSTTDHVLTALTQPVHAITRSRNSGEGYPQDRKIYASWNKPIVLMCNEHSFSNAEILSHAVKQTGRGRLVGMRTAGGVISTGGVRLIDGSFVRMPMRGWFLSSTGQDMELNGCLPDIALWNPPGGEDVQLATAVKALLEDVKKELARPPVELVPAAQKRAQEAR